MITIIVTKHKLAAKNIILSLIWVVFLLVLFGHIFVKSTLSDSWYDFKQSYRCLSSGGSWNCTERYCETWQATEGDCESIRISLPLTNRGGSGLVITYKRCNDDGARFSVEEGRKLVLHHESGSRVIMQFSKIAPETIETAIRHMAYGDVDLPIGCTIKKGTIPGRWTISSSEEDQINCGLYAQSYDHSITRYFAKLHDFLAFIDVPEGGLIESVEIRSVEHFFKPPSSPRAIASFLQ